MKRIKLLHGIIITLVILLIARSFFLIFSIPLGLMKNIIINIPVLLLLGLIYIERGLSYCIKNGYFNSKSILKFKRGGLFFIFSGLISLIMGAIMLFFQTNTILVQNLMYQNISKSFLILVIGLGLVIISDFIKKGNIIQSENDLTI